MISFLNLSKRHDSSHIQCTIILIDSYQHILPSTYRLLESGKSSVSYR